MANPVLFASSLFLAFVHLALILAQQPLPRLFSFTVLCGTFSSIWNHGTTSEIAKWTDRSMMAVGAVVDFAYLSSVPMEMRPLLCGLIVCAILGYFGAKFLVVRAPPPTGKAGKAGLKGGDASPAGNAPHLVAHVLLSLTHFIMTYQLSRHCAEPSSASSAGLFCW